jgi:glycosyltransferase involved in cell wall biosynthesis
MADEIIVVDTGSVDQTTGIARSFDARSYHF